MALSSSVNIVVPTAWEGLTDEQLDAICHWATAGQHTTDDIKALLLTHFFLTPTDRERLTPADLLPAMEELAWLDHPPPVPVRTAKLYGHAAVNAYLHGLSFEHYLIAENCFQGWLASQSAEPLEDMAAILYPSEEERPPLNAGQCYGIALWWTGVKSLFSQEFPDLFRPAEAEGDASAGNMSEAMNAQIRALTAGDITKEQTVLAADCWRALTELNAKAREAREFNERIKK